MIKEVKVLHRVYTVSDMEQQTAGRDGIFGRSNTRDRLIELDMSQHPSELADTLLHEIMHTIWDGMELEDEDKEERIISVLSHGLTTVFHDNPKLLDEIKRLLE